MMEAACSRCGASFEREDGRTKICPDCRVKAQRAYRRKWYKQHVKQRRKAAAKWRDANRAHVREYNRMYKKKVRQRRAIENALKKNVKRDAEQPTPEGHGVD